MERTIDALIRGIDGIQAARYTSAAATTIYIYNILLTLDLEVQHIWTRLSLHLPILFYILNRYVCLVFFLFAAYDLSGFHGDFSEAYCKLPLNYIGFMLAYTSWTGIMTLRVCAIWRQRENLVKFIRILWVCVLCTTYLVGYFSYQERRGATMHYDPLVGICTTTSSPYIFKLTPIMPAVYELFLTILTLIKAFDFRRYAPASNVPMLFRVFARDGVAYFVISTTIIIANIISWYSLPSNHLYFLSSLYWSITSTCMAQLVLNLKDVYHQSTVEQMGTEGVSADVGFASVVASRHLRIEDPFSAGDRGHPVDPVHPMRRLPKADV